MELLPTFAAPIYQRWFEQFPETTDGAGVDVRYDAVGSGKGIAAFTERRVDFGATDVPLNQEELARAEAAGGAVIHIPSVLGAITVVYNLPGSPRLWMDAELIAGLFVGEITTWRDARIAALNPTVRLPDLPVSVVHRSDSSGTTANFTAFLADRAPESGRRVGRGKVVEWITGTGAEGNDGVAAAVKQTAGAVGVRRAHPRDRGAAASRRRREHRRAVRVPDPSDRRHRGRGHRRRQCR